MTLSPLLLLLLGVLAYRTLKGEGRLADMLRRLGDTQAASATDDAPPPVSPSRPMAGTPAIGRTAARSGGLRDAFGGGGNLGAFAGGMAGGMIGSGLHELLHRFRQNGYGDVADSWISTGANQAISPTDLHSALGNDTVSSLAQEAGLSDIDVLSGLSHDLPGAVDDLTPAGEIADDY